VVLAASAGTGKTHALVGVMVNLLLGATGDEKGRLRAPVLPGAIVATTFSRKAAVEMRSRVLVELSRMADPSAKSVYDAWVADALASMGHPAWLPHERAERARAALQRTGELRVSTLHAFATQIVKAYPLEAGFLPEVELLSEAEDQRISEAASERALLAWLDENGDDARALFDALGSFSGMLELVRSVLARVAESGGRADDLTLPTSDEHDVSASMNQVTRLAAFVASHDAAFEPARQVVAAASTGDPFALATAAHAFLAAEYRKRTDIGEEFRSFRAALDGKTNEERGALFSRLYLRRAELPRAPLIAKSLLVRCQAEIDAEKKRENVMGFSDVLMAARTVCQRHLDARKELVTGIDTLLVDEVQDTSRLQRDLIVLLRPRDLSQASLLTSDVARRGLFLVGDRKQSIYGFRGADVGVFAELAVGLAGEPAETALRIPKGMVELPANPTADFEALRINRRGTPELLSFANAMSERIFAPFSGSAPAPFEVAYAKDAEDLLPEPGRVAGDEPRTFWVRPETDGSSSDRMQDALVCARIIADERGRPMPLTKTGKPPSWKDFAILSLTNESLEKAAFALAIRGIPYVVAGRGFYRAREVLDLAMLVDLLCDLTDLRALLAVLRGPLVAAHDESIIGLTDPGRGLRKLSLEWLLGPRNHLIHAEDLPALGRLRDVVLRLSRVLPALGPGPTLREAIAALGFEDTLALLPRAAERIANVRKLLALADREPDHEKFRDELRASIDRETAEADAATFSEDDDAVRLLTVHVSKGLDFPIVLIPEAGALMSARGGAPWLATLPVLDHGPPQLTARFTDHETGLTLVPPSHSAAKEVADRRDRAERQRLLYVAMTRASDRMYFVGLRKVPKSSSREDSSMAAALASVAAAHPTLLHVSDQDPNEPSAEDAVSPPLEAADSAALPEPMRVVPRVRALTIAPTALADFAHCPRRFFLAHDLGLPEFRKARAATPETLHVGVDARREGTLLHAVLEAAPAAAFGSDDAEAFARAEAARLGIPEDEPHHARIVSRATRFLSSSYARMLSEQGATLLREEPFLLSVKGAEGAPDLFLRGTMDLVVRFPSGETHVLDYKRARGPRAEPYAFQLDVYALATLDTLGVVPKTAVVFLGGKSHEPTFLVPREASLVRAELASLGKNLCDARTREAFPRVPVEECHQIVCGYVGRCHPSETRA
jgi:ATP-dependent helicase/nuclease subunit A